MDDCIDEGTEQVVSILKRIDRGDEPRRLCRDARRTVSSMGPKNLATAELVLIDSGYSARTVQQLSAAFMYMGVYREEDNKQDGQLPESHILRKVTVEHEMFRCLLAELENVVFQISLLDELSDTSAEFRRLGHIMRHLSVMKEHIEREEHIIFPYLRKYGWDGLCRAGQRDHINIGMEIDNMVKLVVSLNDVRFEQFRMWLVAVSQRLVSVMLEHLAYEDEILHPIALGVINDAQVWEKIKIVCEEIGYCGLHH